MDFLAAIFIALAGAFIGGGVCWELATSRQKVKNAVGLIAMEMEIERLSRMANYFAEQAQREHWRCERLWARSSGLTN